MSGSELEQPDISNRNTTGQYSNEPEVNPGEMKLEPLVQAEKLSADIERFTGLSSDLGELLTGFSSQIRLAAEQLNRLHIAIDAKKNELKTLHGIEASVTELERLARDYHQQKEDLGILMENQRALWEEEQSKRAQEQKEYLEALRGRREREEDVYQQGWAAEKLKARQKLEEELKRIQQEALEKQQSLERDCLQRELTLKQKELEWIQLIQELEQFMSKLIRRTQTQAAPRADSAAAFAASRSPQPGPGEESPNSSFYFGDAPFPDAGAGEQSRARENMDPLFGNAPREEPKVAISSLKEILLSQGRRIESLNSEPPKKDAAPLKFLPKKPQV